MAGNHFVVVDVETANPDYASICSIGIVEFLNGVIISEWGTLINPEEPFYKPYTGIHHIEPWMVRDKPKYPDVFLEISKKIRGTIVCSYSPFDKAALRQVNDKYGLTMADYPYLDITRVVRRIWKECSISGYGLKNIATMKKIDFVHHDAIEDAKAAGKVLLAAQADSGITIEEWLIKQYNKPPSGFSLHLDDIQASVNQDGPLYGQNICFTGVLSITREQAARKAAQAGCFVQDGVTKKTDILVVGNFDLNHLTEGFDTSAKQRKAEDLLAKGVPIRIIGDQSFFILVDTI